MSPGDLQDGLLLIDKPEGLTSHDVIYRVRRALNRKDVGHAGTLDPMATGLLVLLIGQATKLSDLVLGEDKAYAARLLLGQTTDTDDITGTVTGTRPWQHLTAEQVSQAVRALQGELELTVPQYSAIKVSGQRLYKKARRGEDFAPPRRRMRVEGLQIQELQLPSVSVEFTCSKGTYVRSWVRELGERLGCGATLASLRRLESKPFLLNRAVRLDDLPESQGEKLSRAWIPLQGCLPSWPQVPIEGLDEKLVVNGQIPHRLHRFLEVEYGRREDLPGVQLVSRRSGRLLALLEEENPWRFKIRRVFPLKH